MRISIYDDFFSLNSGKMILERHRMYGRYDSRKKKSSYMEIRIHVIEMKSQIFRPILLGHSSLTMKRENRESYLKGMKEEKAESSGQSRPPKERDQLSGPPITVNNHQKNNESNVPEFCKDRVPCIGADAQLRIIESLTS